MSLCQSPISCPAHARAPAGHARDVDVVITLRSPAAAAPPPPTVVDACDDDDDTQPPSYPRVPLPQQQHPSPIIERIHPAESREAEGGVFYCHGMAHSSFLKQLDEHMDVAVSDGGSYNMAADRRWFNSEDIARQLQSMMPAALGVCRLLPFHHTQRRRLHPSSRRRQAPGRSNGPPVQHLVSVLPHLVRTQRQHPLPLLCRGAFPSSG